IFFFWTQEGKRVPVKDFSDDWPTNSSKIAFEKFVFTEITLLDNNIIVYKFVQDLHFFVTGGDDANEIILAFQFLRVEFCYLDLKFRCTFPHHASSATYIIFLEALENLDLILLCLDEIVGGMILETNGPLIAEKATSHSMDADSPLSEQEMQHSFCFVSFTNTLTQAWATAREHLTRTLLNGVCVHRSFVIF
ncbi:Coatomer subunit zeta-2, partial [Glycine soja]